MSKILRKLNEKLECLGRGESGQDMVEYGLLVLLIALVCVSGAQGVANSVNQAYGKVSQALDAQQSQTPQQQQAPPPPPAPNHDHHHHGGDGGGGGHHWGWWR
jgi:Flp pilus assembly pilin Flp